jgi:hypothetical protein
MAVRFLFAILVQPGGRIPDLYHQAFPSAPKVHRRDAQYPFQRVFAFSSVSINRSFRNIRLARASSITVTLRRSSIASCSQSTTWLIRPSYPGDRDAFRAKRTRAVAGVAAGPSHCGACRPGDDSHLSMCAAVSIWRAFRKSARRSLPVGAVRAFRLSRPASASCAKRSRNVIAFVKRSVCMTLQPVIWRGSAFRTLR